MPTERHLDRAPLKRSRYDGRLTTPIAPAGRDDRRSGRVISSDDERTAAQKDCDRILYSLAFRRLATVTQVVGPLEGYIFHNRLTHTLEVAQIARRLAERLIKLQPDAAVAIDPDVVECAAMAHDLGHPPFGHAAEEELQSLAEKHGLKDGFEGNAQSFRIVTRLAELRPGGKYGLDLSRASLNAVLKYPWLASADAPPRPVKYGAYYSDRDAFDFARATGPAPDQRCVEAQIMDVADDIAYSVHDIDDFYRAGLLPLDQLATDTALLDEFLERWEKDGGPSLAIQQVTQLKNLLELPRLGLPYTGTRAQREGLRAFTSSQIGWFMGAVTLNASERQIKLESARELEIQFLKRLVWEFVITNPRLASLQSGQRRIVRELFAIYLEAILDRSDSSAISRLPPLFREDADNLRERDSSPDEAVRLAIDIVASFGDEQATQMMHRLTGVRVGNLSDVLGP